MAGMLDGIRVIDLTQSVSGPWATWYLWCMGAEIIKIERPDKPEDTRFFPPYYDNVPGGESVTYAQLNRGKKHITLDFTTPEGLALFMDLVKTSDVVVENFAPGKLAKNGITYESLSAVNPGVIFASVSGFGQTGPMSPLPGYDTVIQAMSGIMATTGFPDGPPLKTGSIIVDLQAGTFAALGICGALFKRESTGKGERLDIAMYDTALNQLEAKFLEWSQLKHEPQRMGNRYPLVTPFDAFPTKDDSFIIICCAGDNTFKNLAKAMGRPELIDDPKYATNPMRNVNEPELREMITAWTKTLTAQEIMGTLMSGGVPVSPIQPVSAAIDNPQVEARGMKVEVTQPDGKVFNLYGPAIKASNNPLRDADVTTPHGGDNEWVLKTVLGKSDDEVKDILSSGPMAKK